MANESSQEQYAAQQAGQYSADVNVKLRDIEEKQNLIKDRIILIGENLISEKQETEQEIIKIKADIKNLADDVRKIKLAIQRLVDAHDNYAKKSEVEMLQRQFQMFQPLEFARISDVKSMIEETLEKNKTIKT